MSEMEKVRILRFTDSSHAKDAMEAKIAELLPEEATLRVLDVGCGDKLRVKIPAPIHLVGIDISPEQLERNTIAQEKILGDVESYPFEPDCFDVIVCWDVLEHLPRPERVLKNLISTLKPGGLLLIEAPNPCSLKGLITKFTPHWFHVLAHRLLLGNKNAGKPGYPPFLTYLRFMLRPKRLVRWSVDHGLQPEFVAMATGGHIRALQRHRPLLGYAYAGLSLLLKGLSFGAYDGSMTELYAVLRKPKR